MKMDFAPSRQRLEVSSDLRATRCNVSQLKGVKSVPIDFRVSREVVQRGDWRVSAGSKFVLSLDEEGSWHFTQVMPGEPGYTLRMPKATKSFLQLRINVTPSQAARIFTAAEHLDYDFLGQEDGVAIFVPKSGMRFAPRR
jgi:hypothetical protein